MRENITTQTDTTFLLIVAVSIVLLLIVSVSMVYFVIRYNKKKNPKASNISGNTRLEILWTAIPTLLVLGMFFSGYVGFKNLRTPPDDAFVVKVTGRMWVWSFEYENGKKSDTLYVPLSKPIKVLITSNDVNHSFYLPDFRVKEDAVPGRVNMLWFKPQQVGTYNIACAEYCGLSHYNMYAKLVVMDDTDFQRWYTTIPDTTNKTNP